MTDLTIRGARALLPHGTLTQTDIAIADGHIDEANGLSAGRVIDAQGLLLLPGIVDLHGDAFERQIMPRPGVHFPIDLALIDTDRQLAANGITTAFHGLTWSWEPGLRGREAAFALFDGMERIRPRLLTDTRIHLRHEVYNTGAVDSIVDLITAGRVGLLAFNDHLPMMKRKSNTPQKLVQYAERADLSLDAYIALIDEVAARESMVAPTNDRIAAAARENQIAMASHDDPSPDLRKHFHEMGCALCEFPLNRPTLEAARGFGDAIIMGSPNVVRGGSHTGGLRVADMVKDGLVDILTSDYYYPALLQAPFKLMAEGQCDFATAWSLVSTNPARAVGLHDRGTIATGQRADLILVDDRDPTLPHVVATIAGGRVIASNGGPAA
ncbi:MAG TPA: alpha-D-ribose 1-methylphosphonate 5-triphosphate diphosphatase [Magnetospirillaceae bacterium]|jgi:alpha-D-ribose 1-methylphosphonate 5-triphosphate diphosphatase